MLIVVKLNWQICKQTTVYVRVWVLKGIFSKVAEQRVVVVQLPWTARNKLTKKVAENASVGSFFNLTFSEQTKTHINSKIGRSDGKVWVEDVTLIGKYFFSMMITAPAKRNGMRTIGYPEQNARCGKKFKQHIHFQTTIMIPHRTQIKQFRVLREESTINISK